MRLYELIDYEPKKSNITAHTNMSRILNKTRGQEVGGGAFGSVYDTQSNKRLKISNPNIFYLIDELFLYQIK